MAETQLPLLPGRVVVVEDAMFPAGIEGSVVIKTKDRHIVTEHRTRVMATEVFRRLVSHQTERYALVIHGDMLPTRPFTWEELFEGQRYAVAGGRSPDGRILWHTQLLGVDLSQGPLEPAWHKWPVEQCRVWRVFQTMQEGRRVEMIEPCWSHLTCMAERARKSRGLGDTIAKITTKLGIKPCKGCKKRQKWLNRIFPYRNGPPQP